MSLITKGLRKLHAIDMAGLLSIPFEVHVSIVRTLSVKDCIAYMQVCTVSHDVVYYVFAHRKELDFESVLDESRTIALSPEMLMKVLYAHTRVISIMNLSLNPRFTMLDEFCRYFNMYWAYKIVDTEQFDSYPEAVGHPSGHLERLRYLGRGGGGSTHEQNVVLYSLWRYSQDWYRSEDNDAPIYEHDDETKSYLSSTEANWSSVDVDAPYTWCWECSGVCTCTMEADSDIDKDGDECEN